MPDDPSNGAPVVEQTLDNGGAPSTPAPETAPAPPPSADVLNRLLAHQAQMQQRLDGIAPAHQPAQAPQAAEPDESDPDLAAAARALFGDEGNDDPDEGITMEALQTAFGAVAKKAAEQAVAPILNRYEQEHIEDGFDRLEERLPALSDPETADAVISAATEAAARFGNPALVLQPDFIELAYLAHAARTGQQGGGEPTPPAPPHLETANGATPQAGGEVDPSEEMGDAIVAAGGRNAFWGFGAGGT